MEGVIAHKIEDLLGIRGERPTTLYEESRNLEEIKYERVPRSPAIRASFHTQALLFSCDFVKRKTVPESDSYIVRL